MLHQPANKLHEKSFLPEIGNQFQRFCGTCFIGPVNKHSSGKNDADDVETAQSSHQLTEDKKDVALETELETRTPSSSIIGLNFLKVLIIHFTTTSSQRKNGNCGVIDDDSTKEKVITSISDNITLEDKS
ncbi:unnamed protein product [Onchocerca flexuosa]|uniref:Uncharacterized protein n=1 Tax=Onchocerca flexuosa TaxID=387005 RepID=A0A183HYM0_9BILA|nr:unnamed protein product [Onchocerca flexuosa]